MPTVRVFRVFRGHPERRRLPRLTPSAATASDRCGPPGGRAGRWPGARCPAGRRSRTTGRVASYALTPNSASPSSRATATDPARPQATPASDDADAAGDDAAEDVVRPRAERDANPDLARALRDEVHRHTVGAADRQHERERREHGEHPGERRAQRHRLPDLILHRPARGRAAPPDPSAAARSRIAGVADAGSPAVWMAIVMLERGVTAQREIEAGPHRPLEAVVLDVARRRRRSSSRDCRRCGT